MVNYEHNRRLDSPSLVGAFAMTTAFLLEPSCVVMRKFWKCNGLRANADFRLAVPMAVPAIACIRW